MFNLFWILQRYWVNKARRPWANWGKYEEEKMKIRQKIKDMILVWRQQHWERKKKSKEIKATTQIQKSLRAAAQLDIRN